MTNKLTPTEVLNIAINQEIGGELFYSIAGEKVEDTILKSLLTRLAHDEKKHVFIFKTMLENISSGELSAFNFDDNVQKYFSVLIDTIFETDSDEIDRVIEEMKSPLDILSYAIQKERDSLHLYFELNMIIKSPETRNIISDIINEEREHFFSLSNEYQKRKSSLIDGIK